MTNVQLGFHSNHSLHVNTSPTIDLHKNEYQIGVYHCENNGLF